MTTDAAARLRPEDVQEMREKHYEEQGLDRCWACKTVYPCDTTRALDALTRAEAERERLEAERGNAVTLLSRATATLRWYGDKDNYDDRGRVGETHCWQDINGTEYAFQLDRGANAREMLSHLDVHARLSTPPPHATATGAERDGGEVG